MPIKLTAASVILIASALAAKLDSSAELEKKGKGHEVK